MARDRLAALRAQQAAPGGAANDFSFPQQPQQASNATEQAYQDYAEEPYYSQPREPEPAYYGGGQHQVPASRQGGTGGRLPSGPRGGSTSQRPRPNNPPPVAALPVERLPVDRSRERTQYAPSGYPQQRDQYARQQQLPRWQETYESEKRARAGSDQSEESYAMKEQTPRKRTGGKTIKAGDVPFEEMGLFFVEVSDVQQALRTSADSIQQIQSIHLRLLSLASADTQEGQRLKQDLAQITSVTRNLFSDIKARLLVLEQGNANLRALIPVGQSVHHLSLGDVATRRTQVDALKAKFKETIQRYAEVERDNRAKNRTRLVRQVKIVSPGMNDNEVAEVVKNVEQGNGSGLFSQALLQSNGQHSYAARGALREVETRAAELARIETTLVELAQLFNDMAVLVEAQDIQIVQVEQSTEMATKDMAEGLDQTKKAVVSARSARKWRWVCCGIMVLILVIVAIVVVFEVVLPIVRKNNSSSNKSTSSSSSASSSTSSSALTTGASNNALAVTGSSGALDTIPIASTVTYVEGSGNGGFLPSATARARMRRTHRPRR